MTLANVSIDDKFTLDRGRVLISGTQALVRASLAQRQRDQLAGLNTAGFISGYRGSPLGGLDLQLAKAKALLGESDVHFEPGLNEDLAATAVWGTQQVNALPNPARDGVFGMWYGKGPGVDRSGDALKHANFAGTSPHGGVLAVFGDDHPGKSSTVAHQSEYAFASFCIPVLYPASVQEYLDYAALGWAASRYSGLWMSFKCVNETVESTSTVDIDPDRVKLVLPERDDGNFHLKLRYAPAEDDMIVQRIKLPRMQAFAAANGFDRVAVGDSSARFGIVTAGKAYLDVMQALDALGIDDERARHLGIAVYKIGLSWPIDGHGLRHFASGKRELIFVEEKRPFIEEQAAGALYHLPDGKRPQLSGKRAPSGETLLPSDVQLDAHAVASAIVARLRAAGVGDDALWARAGAYASHGDEAASTTGAEMARTPFFCSGCPHNSSTKLPAGSMAASGIGCHGMAAFSDPNTITSSQMGAEGATWIGISRFTDMPHMFQNLGDGTYSHSGLLAIRAAVNAKVNLTYKILFNDAVAMTGGQTVEGDLTVDTIARQVAAEGIRHIALVSDEPEKYHRGYKFPPTVNVHHRRELDLIQRQMRETPGVTVIIYDQTCAAEKRRRRKRGTFANPAKRAFINEQVCEGCGDCSVQANCISIQPKDTPFGRKRVIDQSSCNKDFSCVYGFCPSFVTVNGAEPRKAQPKDASALGDIDIPSPATAKMNQNYNILINGIGGTGVVTIGSVLGMAAHLQGDSASIYDMTGLAQKGGTVFSHLRIGKGACEINGTRLAPGSADLVIGCDLVVSASRDSLSTCHPGTTKAVLNSRLVPTGAFQLNPDIKLEVNPLDNLLRKKVGDQNMHMVDASGTAETLMGDTIGANMFMVGYALQQGLLPIGAQAIERAIELNGVAIQFNLDALRLGRLAAHDPALVAKLLADDADADLEDEPTLDGVIADRVARLTAYQDAAYAQQYGNLLAHVRQAESNVARGRDALTRAVARYLFKVMAYKDEYEVARMYTDGVFEKALAEQFEPGYTLSFHMAPPWLAGKDPSTGLPAKREFGPWMMSVLKLIASMKGLRGGGFDVFGLTQERRMERRIRDDYTTLIKRVAGELTAENYDIAVELAEVPERIRGYGHVKRAHLERAKAHEQSLLERWAAPADVSSQMRAEAQTA